MNVVLFFTSVFLFLSGMPGIAGVGVALVFGAFLFWGRGASLLSHIAAGLLAGLMLDTYSPLPFGTHVLIFCLLSLGMNGTKIMLVHRFLWGDFGVIVLGVLAGEVLIVLVPRFLGYSGELWSLNFFLLRLLVLLLFSAIVWALLRYEYAYSLPHSLVYRR